MKATLFFDLDGILANFVEGSLAWHKATLPISHVRWAFPCQIGFADENDPKFWSGLGYDFWSNLPLHSDGVELLRESEKFVPTERIGFLTSPCDTEGCTDGKRAWVAKHFPDYSKRLMIGKAKHLFASPGKILIDDHDKNVDAFMDAGGYALQPPRPWNRNRDFARADGSFNAEDIAAQLRAFVNYIERA